MSVNPDGFIKMPGADNLYDHLTSVLLKIVQEKPVNALTAFETDSLTTKVAAEPFVALDAAATEAVGAASQAMLDLIKPPKKKAAGDEEEDEEEEEVLLEQAPMPDIMAQASLLDWAGVGLPTDQMWEWVLSIQALATAKELTNVRFWGIVRGTKADYHIVEAKLEEYPEEEEGEASKNEPMGSGANECIYFVANTATGGWTKLAAVQSSHIILSTQMKRFFTGDLNAPVLGFPRFPHGEAAYLRAQIARISAGAYVVPKDVFTVDPDDEEQTVAENEEYGGITPMLTGPATWVHARTHLLKEGRTTAWVDPNAEDEEEDEEREGATENVVVKEIAPPKLRTLGEDAGTGQWKYEVYPHRAAKDAVAAALCMRWPGAVAVAQGKTYVNFYNGWGQKFGTGYAPPSPPEMAEEYVSAFDPATGEEDPLSEQTDELPPEDWTAPEAMAEEEEEDDDDEPAVATEEAEE